MWERAEFIPVRSPRLELHWIVCRWWLMLSDNSASVLYIVLHTNQDTRNYVTRMKFLDLQCEDDVKWDWLLKEDCAGSGIWCVQVRGYCVGWFWRQDHIHSHALAFRTHMFMSRANVLLSSICSVVGQGPWRIDSAIGIMVKTVTTHLTPKTS
jgi:hypothetical protein